MNRTNFVETLKLAAKSDTVYLWGTFGIRLSEGLIEQKKAQYPQHLFPQREAFLRRRLAEADGTVWAFDCVGLLKGVLWGWQGDEGRTYGGGVYGANGVPDATADGLFAACEEKSTDFTRLSLGDFLWMPGHIGAYLGDGVVAEATLGDGFDGVVVRPLAGRGWLQCGIFSRKLLTSDENGENLPNDGAEKDPSFRLFVQKEGLYLRETLNFSGKKPTGNVLAFCPPGGEMEVVGFVPGLQADGYQWLRTRYDGKEGYSQLDSRCYYIQQKE